MTKLALVPVHDRIPDPQPAAFKELAAAKYVGLSRAYFRKLVFSGLIPFAKHVDGKTRIFLRADLDSYLDGLQWSKMDTREVSLVALKGVK